MIAYGELSAVWKTWWGLLLAGLLLLGSTTGVQAEKYTAIITGIGGDKTHHDRFQEFGSNLARGLSHRFGYKNNVHWLAETSKDVPRAERRSDSAGIYRLFKKLNEQANETDELLVFMIGHANGRGRRWRLNLPGPDISARGWKRLFADFPGRVAVIVSAPFSREVVPVWSQPDRPIITSSRSDERNQWMFHRALTRLLLHQRVGDTEADYPVVRSEANLATFFEKLARFYEQFRRREGYMHDQHPALEANGDGIATEATAYLKNNNSEDKKPAQKFKLGAGPRWSDTGPGKRAELSSAGDTLSPKLRRLIADTSGLTGDAVVLLRRISGELDNELTAEWEYHVAIKVLTESGRRYANVQRQFFPGKKVELKEARTILPSGRIIPVDTHAVLKRSGYDPLEDRGDTAQVNPTRMALHFSKPKPGAVLEYRYTVRDRNYSIGGEYSGGIRLQGRLPIKNLEVTFKYPEARKINVVPWFPPAQKIDTGLARRREPYTRVIEFTASEVPAVRPEPVADPVRLRQGKLVFSTFNSWNRIARWYHYLARASRQATPKVKELARRLTAPDSSAGAKIRALYEWVSEEIRYVSIPLGVHGYKPRMVPNMLEWRYGDCKDKASLLMTLLREVGIESKMVLIGAGLGDIIAAAPRKTAFNHAIVALPRNGGEFLFLDPTAGNAPYGTLPPMDQGRQALVVHGDTGRLVRTPYTPPDSNTLKITRQIRLKGDDLVVREQRIARGHPAFKRRSLLRRAGKAQARRTVKQRYSSRYGDVELHEYEVQKLTEINEPLREELHYQISGVAHGTLSLPWAPSPLAGVTPLEDRQAEISLGTTVNLQERNFVRDFTHKSIKETAENRLGEARFEVRPADTGIVASRSLRLEQPRAPAPAYPDLVALAQVEPYDLSFDSEPTGQSFFQTWKYYLIAGEILIVLILGIGVGYLLKQSNETTKTAD